jgi:hypothetical protein
MYKEPDVYRQAVVNLGFKIVDTPTGIFVYKDTLDIGCNYGHLLGYPSDGPYELTIVVAGMDWIKVRGSFEELQNYYDKLEPGLQSLPFTEPRDVYSYREKINPKEWYDFPGNYLVLGIALAGLCRFTFTRYPIYNVLFGSPVQSVDKRTLFRND